MTQIEYGKGDVWSFEASRACTSGVFVVLDGGKVKPAAYSGAGLVGVTLIPASAGDYVSVVMNGIVKVMVTGGDGTAGNLIRASDGYAFPFTPNGSERHDLVAGILLEDTTNGNTGKIKLRL